MSVSGKKLLIVDDDASVRSSLEDVFSTLGYSVTTAENGSGALAVLREQVPDILLTELNMPGMSGFELLSIVNRSFPGVRAIAMSGAFSRDSVPVDVPAAAFYEEGGPMACLLSAVEAPLLKKRSSEDGLHPMLIRKSGQDALVEDFVMMACPECLRTFSRAVGGTASMILDTSCIYCGSLILCVVGEPQRPPVVMDQNSAIVQ